MPEQVIGNIQFGNSRIGHALSVIQDEWVEGHMWKEEFYKAEYALDKANQEIKRLKKLLRRKSGKQIKG